MHSLLVELGTEELPPKSLASLGQAFASALRDEFVRAALLDENAPPLDAFWSPRRLAARARGIRTAQPDRTEIRRGPTLKAAYDASGKPTKAAAGFARANGVAADALQTLETDEGAWVFVEREIRGLPVSELLPGLVETALARLPIARRMRWGAGEAQFVRPVHWLVMLLDGDVVPGEVLGVAADRKTQGHRFLARGPVSLTDADDYPGRLEAEGKVRTNAPDGRLDLAITEMVRQAAVQAGGQPRLETALVAEVAALVEWPVPVTGSFDRRFLALPVEVIESVLQLHQRYFPVYDGDGSLLPHFIAVANLDSRDPDVVRKGNERVILPRLTDAEFFYAQDRKHSLSSRADALGAVTFQAKLGSLADKSIRVASLAAHLAPALSANLEHVRRAAELAKCDLLTLMVGEFPELQGTMGMHYARHDGEHPAVAQAIEEQYLPRFAGDRVPTSPEGRALALADRLDTIVGVFAIGARPTGDKDPYGLRRAALGVLRILLDSGGSVDLADAARAAAGALPAKLHADGLADEVVTFVIERLRAFLADEGTAPDVFEAVLAAGSTRPVDFVARVRAVDAFTQLPDAAALSAANKRIANILKQADDAAVPVNASLFADPTESALLQAVNERESVVRPLLDAADYTAALRELAALRAPVDALFDGVMVMADDPAVRANRVALLARVAALFGEVADIGRLQRAG
ncbi:MAG: glycine--tRNA ligase subunit beta [Gammaproteobacteria bacterium]